MKQSKGSRNGPAETTRPTRRRLRLYAIALIVVLFAAAAFLVKTLSNRHKSQSNPDHHSHPPSANGTDRNLAAHVGIKNTVAPGEAPDGMVWVPGGTFWMGCDDCDM